MQLKIALDEKELDYRVRDRLIAEGKLKKEEVNKHLQQLPDDANKSQQTQVEQ
jgi:hypothetical protein